MRIRLSMLIGLLASGLLMGAAPGAAANPGAAPPGLPAAAPPLVQDFQDVPTSSPFYAYVHNLFVDGVVGGYTCGGPGEPCVPPGNLPYFRPGANVTRGQNAKFTDNGRRVLSGDHAAGNPAVGLFSALNTATASSANAGLFGRGATGVSGEGRSSGSAAGYGGYFANFNTDGSTGQQFGAYGEAVYGWGLEGVSDGANPLQASAGVVGLSGWQNGAGGVFTATVGNHSVGLVAAGPSGALIKVAGVGDTNFSFYGNAHIRGTNITADSGCVDLCQRGRVQMRIRGAWAKAPSLCTRRARARPACRPGVGLG